MLALLLAVVVGEAKPAEALKKLDGEWVVEKTTFDGKDQALPAGTTRGLVFAGGKMTTVVNGKKGGSLDVTAGEKAGEFDLARPGTTSKSKGRFTLDGKTLRLAYGEPGKDRPEKVESAEGERVFLLVLRKK